MSPASEKVPPFSSLVTSLIETYPEVQRAVTTALFADEALTDTKQDPQYGNVGMFITGCRA